MKKKSPFYKTGPLFYKQGAMSPLNNKTPEVTDENTQSVPATKASDISLGRITASTIGTDYSNFDFGSKNLTSTETPKIDVEAGIATGKGSGKTNRARRKKKKDKMKAEGKSSLDVRQTKTKSKIAETKAKLSELGDSSNQGKRERLASRLKFQIARDKRMTGRKAKREAIKNYGK